MSISTFTIKFKFENIVKKEISLRFGEKGQVQENNGSNTLKRKSKSQSKLTSFNTSRHQDKLNSL